MFWYSRTLLRTTFILRQGYAPPRTTRNDAPVACGLCSVRCREHLVADAPVSLKGVSVMGAIVAEAPASRSPSVPHGGLLGEPGEQDHLIHFRRDRDWLRS